MDAVLSGESMAKIARTEDDETGRHRDDLGVCRFAGPLRGPTIYVRRELTVMTRTTVGTRAPRRTRRISATTPDRDARCAP